MGWGMGKGANTVKLVQGIIARVVAAAAEQQVIFFHLATKSMLVFVHTCSYDVESMVGRSRRLMFDIIKLQDITAVTFTPSSWMAVIKW